MNWGREENGGNKVVFCVSFDVSGRWYSRNFFLQFLVSR